MKIRCSSMLVMLLIGLLNVQCQQKHTFLGEEQAKEFLVGIKKGEGSLLSQVIPLVKDQETAIAIAEAVLFKVYGKENIIKQKPYEVYHIDKHWVLFGTLPEGSVGGVFEIGIDARDGRIVGLSHGK